MTALILWVLPTGRLFWGPRCLSLTYGTGRRIPVYRRAMEVYVLCGLLGTVIPGVLFFYTAVHVPAGVLSVTISTVPLLTFVLASLLGVETVTIVRVTGVLFGLAAVVFLVGPEESLPDPTIVPWVLLALCAAMCYAIENMVIAIRSHNT